MSQNCFLRLGWMPATIMVSEALVPDSLLESKHSLSLGLEEFKGILKLTGLLKRIAIFPFSPLLIWQSTKLKQTKKGYNIIFSDSNL